MRSKMRTPLIFVVLCFVAHPVYSDAGPQPRVKAARIDPQAAARGVARFNHEAEAPAVSGRESSGAPSPVAGTVGAVSPSGAVLPSAAEGSPPATPVAPASTPAAVPPPDTQVPEPAPPRFIGPPIPLTLSVRQAMVPVGETRVVTVMGALRAPEATVTPADVLSLGLTPGPAPGTWSLTLRGTGPGEAVVRVTSGSDVQVLPVRVLKYAALVTPATVEITGQPAPAEFVLQAARAAVNDAVKPESGAVVTVGRTDTAPPEVPAGQSATVSFPVSVAGPDLIPVKAVVSVTVRNRDLDAREVGVLLYSNDPERVTAAGTLFAADLARDQATRLLYHHQNAGSEPLRLRLELVNPTDQPIDAQVIEGAAGPTWDAVEAGHRAAARYLHSALHEIGTIVRVPPRSQQAIALGRMTPRSTVSGIFGLRSLASGLSVRVSAEPDTAPSISLRPAAPIEKLSDQVYPAPERPVHARYVVGKNWTFLKLGGDPIAARGSHKKLQGNYGVSYELSLDLSNPTDQPQSVLLTLSPDAGDARGVFVIDGSFIEAPVTSPPLEADLATFLLQPGERRMVRVQTLPVGGSSYPARLVLKPAAPLRAAQATDPR
jgi:hypothetical protein